MLPMLGKLWRNRIGSVEGVSLLDKATRFAMFAVALAAISCAALCSLPLFGNLGAAWAQTDDPPSIVEPKWKRRPLPEELFDAFPAGAPPDKNALVMLTCRVSVRGLLEDCKAEEKETIGYGYGAAALSLVPRFLMEPA